jgi:hypothetical protein
MNPIVRILVPGLAGGLVFAWILVQANRRSKTTAVIAAGAPGQPTTDMINIAHIRVAGVGGLGLVAVCAMVAAFIPAVGFSLAAGAGLGAMLAIGMIARRRKTGPMPSSSEHMGANSVLAIDEVR